METCNPTLFGIFLRLLIAGVFIWYGYAKENYLVLFIGFIPLLRLSYYFLFIK